MSGGRKLAPRSIFIRDTALALLRDGEWHTTTEIVRACFGGAGTRKYMPFEREWVTTQLRRMAFDGTIECAPAGGYHEGEYRLPEVPVEPDDLRDMINSLDWSEGAS